MLEQKLAEILKVVESGVIWTADQVPLIVKELFVWKTCLYIFGVIVGMTLTFIAYRFYAAAKKRVDQDDCHDWDDEIAAYFGIIIPALFGIIIFITDLCNLLQITLAPRIWLIEYISSIVSS